MSMKVSPIYHHATPSAKAVAGGGHLFAFNQALGKVKRGWGQPGMQWALKDSLPIQITPQAKAPLVYFPRPTTACSDASRHPILMLSASSCIRARCNGQEQVFGSRHI